MFPAHLCAALRRLRENVPCHSSEVSAQTVEAAFGAPLAAVFREFEVEALASGAIAQVHRAVLHSGQQVAVKVRHPDVEWRLEQDTRILFALCNGLATLPGLGFLGIPTSVDEFARSVQAQTDLSHEASNLLRFRRNFGLDAPGAPALDVDFPRPVAGLVSPSALVLSWEGGETIQRYIDERHPANKRLAQLGYDVFMTMILVHNFAHADCHAGNIFVRGDFEANKAADARPRLVVLDAGLVSRLSRPSKENLVKLLAHVVRADGRRAADMFLYMSSVRGSDEEGFRASMAELFARECAARPVKVGALISHTMQLVRAHGLRLDSEFASVIVSMTLLEGLATALDPEIDLVRGLAPFVLRRPAAVLRGLAASPSERFLPRMRSRARSHPTPESLDLLWH
jgi:predicted unusual protein kinase regulating ubiquinone biosynthesis (AarF/ABC1/UbiB family)